MKAVFPWPVELRRSRRRSLAIEIRKDLTVLVRAPVGLPEREIAAFLREKEAWINTHLAALEERLRALESAPKLTLPEVRTLAEQAAGELPPRVELWAGRLGVSYGRITVRAMRTRWGSCSDRGALSFNCLLMLCPESVREYVVIHELCHRREMNHSPRFWALVESACPGYREQIAWLKQNGSTLIARLPTGEEEE